MFIFDLRITITRKKRKIMQRDNSPERCSKELASLEKKLDLVYREKRDYGMTGISDYQKFLQIERQEKDNVAILRVMKKLTWLMTFPHNYDDGLWEKF